MFNLSNLLRVLLLLSGYSVSCARFQGDQEGVSLAPAVQYYDDFELDLEYFNTRFPDTLFDIDAEQANSGPQSMKRKRSEQEEETEHCFDGIFEGQDKFNAGVLQDSHAKEESLPISNEDKSTIELLSDLYKRRNFVYAALLFKYQKLFPRKQSRTIFWAQIEVEGWPEEVLFYGYDFWTEKDVEQLENNIDRITFKPAAAVYCRHSLAEKKILFTKLLKLTERIYKSRKIPWKAGIKRDFPGFHITSNSYKRWTSRDVQVINEIILVLESRFPDSNENITDLTHGLCSLPEQTGTDFNDGTVKNIQIVQALLLDKFFQATGKHHERIDWRNYEVIGWPEEVLFYHYKGWTISDHQILKNRMDQITFRMIENPGKSTSMRERMLKDSQLRRLHFTLFNSYSISWNSDMKSIFPALHLSHLDYRSWTASDMKNIDQLISILEERIRARISSTTDAIKSNSSL